MMAFTCQVIDANRERSPVAGMRVFLRCISHGGHSEESTFGAQTLDTGHVHKWKYLGPQSGLTLGTFIQTYCTSEVSEWKVGFDTKTYFGAVNTGWPVVEINFFLANKVPMKFTVILHPTSVRVVINDNLKASPKALPVSVPATKPGPHLIRLGRGYSSVQVTHPFANGQQVSDSLDLNAAEPDLICPVPQQDGSSQNPIYIDEDDKDLPGHSNGEVSPTSARHEALEAFPLDCGQNPKICDGALLTDETAKKRKGFHSSDGLPEEVVSSFRNLRTNDEDDWKKLVRQYVRQILVDGQVPSSDTSSPITPSTPFTPPPSPSMESDSSPPLSGPWPVQPANGQSYPSLVEHLHDQSSHLEVATAQTLPEVRARIELADGPLQRHPSSARSLQAHHRSGIPRPSTPYLKPLPSSELPTLSTPMTPMPSPMTLHFQCPDLPQDHIQRKFYPSNAEPIVTPARRLLPRPTHQHDDLAYYPAGLKRPSVLADKHGDRINQVPPINRTYKVSEWNSLGQSPFHLPPLQSSLPPIDRLQNEDPWSPPRPHFFDYNRQSSWSSTNSLKRSPLGQSVPGKLAQETGDCPPNTILPTSPSPWAAHLATPATSGTFNQCILHDPRVFLPSLGMHSATETMPPPRGRDTPHPFNTPRQTRDHLRSLNELNGILSDEVTEPKPPSITSSKQSRTSCLMALSVEEHTLLKPVSLTSPTTQLPPIHGQSDEKLLNDSAPIALDVLSTLAGVRLAEMASMTASPSKTIVKEEALEEKPVDSVHDCTKPTLELQVESDECTIIVDTHLLDVGCDIGAGRRCLPRASLRPVKSTQPCKQRRSSRKRRRT
ncbi:hypothetical protein EG329_003761 [Mollisiaceae sp. DMI_Dod_QoI]|nr:hypothetical protein EG329_003761 [Helotiales sp. DMI_Dod_QoI]